VVGALREDAAEFVLRGRNPQEVGQGEAFRDFVDQDPFHFREFGARRGEGRIIGRRHPCHGSGQVLVTDQFGLQEQVEPL
jgi:hypothetical protein